MRVLLGGFLFLLLIGALLTNIPLRLPVVERQIRSGLKDALIDFDLESEDLFLRVIPWRGSVRLSLTDARFNSPPFFQKLINELIRDE